MGKGGPCYANGFLPFAKTPSGGLFRNISWLPALAHLNIRFISFTDKLIIESEYKERQFI